MIVRRSAGEGNVPEHIDDAVRSVAELHNDHRGRASAPQRTVNRITAFIARPWSIAFLALATAIWIAVNLLARSAGYAVTDAPDFPFLQAAAELISLFIVMLVLAAQKHEDELNARRDILTLELAILSEHKIAKVIELLEELRRDSPQVRDRVDRQADQMAEPADAGSVFAATKTSAPQSEAILP